jgi:hypothetical protein
MLRSGVALALAILIHLSAWQTLAGIRLLLPSRAPPPPIIDVALLPAARTALTLPARRAVVRAQARHSTGSAPLTAVRTEGSGRPRTPRSPAPTPQPTPVPATAPSAQESAAPEVAGAGGAPPPPAGADSAVASATPNAPAQTAPAPALAPAPVPGVPTVSAAPQASPAPPALAHAPVQVVLPKSARLVYASYGSVRVGGIMLAVRGRTTMRWRFRDGHYQSDLNVDVVNFGQSSQGLFDPDFGLEPERYSETRPHHPISTTQFDWANRRVTFTEGSQPAEAEPGTQDRLSVQFQLSVLRQVYPERFVRGGVMPITLAGTRDVSRWTFTVTGEDIVDSGLGHLPALRVLSNRTTASGDESLEVWISERLDWFPARIRMVDKNRNVLDFVLDEAAID